MSHAGLLLALLLSACPRAPAGEMRPKEAAAAGAHEGGPQVVLHPRGGGPPWRISVELARTPEQHARGLMYRERLDADSGMLFLFEREELRRFWMKNTYISLDMLFLDGQRRVVGIEERTSPHDERNRGPDEPARYVLEVAGGEARRHGIGIGARAEFVNVE